MEYYKIKTFSKTHKWFQINFPIPQPEEHSRNSRNPINTPKFVVYYKRNGALFSQFNFY